MQSYISVNLESSGRIESSKRKSKGGTSGPHPYHRRKERSSSSLPPRERFKYWMRKVITVLFSQVGVGSLLICYTILGAMLFTSIESRVDTRRLSQVATLRSTTVLQLWNVTQNYNVLYGLKWQEDVDQIVRRFRDELVREIKLGYEGVNAKRRWTFPQALMFSLSVYTTIGYGNLTPKTDWGKATTCLYAIFGIPLLLLYMANVGDLLATSFQQFYRTLNRCKTRINKMKELSRERRRRERMSLEGESEQREALIVGAVSGEASPSTAPGDYAKIGQREDKEQIGLSAGKQGHRVNVVPNEKSPQEYNESEANEVTTIPISTCLSVFFCYILFGSMLFSWWEDWEYFEGSYFCFVSLVTIGFSDMVPGKSRSIGMALSSSSLVITEDSKSSESGINGDASRSGDGGNEDGDGNGIGGTGASGSNGREESLDHVDGQLILCAIYILFGMALMAMCFHLTQERFFVTAKKLGRTLRLI